ncbi:glycosyltransferase family 4 protein [Bradyrhizobium diazoefficiens]|uniref:glycosyltransferase family 4 protein n=1 Tax=Bradyrhizobium diazoefficiens TaxID=1355477 RepID=UPI00190C7DE9|nr:glycosyltransferase family 4 protein [Bradyrhizobium diazoefficiens]MBK3665349.1 glycosyltransferase family 4 protein [Bradyrhizobium diazoefficiens]
MSSSIEPAVSDCHEPSAPERANGVPHKVAFVTIVPSPYQRDLFAALAKRREIDLNVYYMEAGSPDSPWPAVDLERYEHILPGSWYPIGPVRAHVNWRLPNLANADFVILSSYTSLTGQLLMHARLRRSRWIFWGERPRTHTGAKGLVQRGLMSPMSAAAAIVGIGGVARRIYQDHFPRQQTFNIPYHCDIEAFHRIERPKRSEGPLTFLFCGQMIARKGLDILLAAFDRLVLAGHDATLRLVGREAELSDMLRQVDPKTKARIDYLGFQPPERLPEFFAGNDVFVLPSRHDGWGVVVNQALAAGIPVICSDNVGAAMDLVRPGFNGLLVKAGDVDSLAAALQQLVEAPAVLDEWSRNARETSRDLTPEAGAEKWVRVFDSLARSNPS